MIEIAVEPEEAARDHDDHQHVRVQIPADLKPACSVAMISSAVPR